MSDLEHDLTAKCQRGAMVTKSSGARRYTFYWFASGRRLAVKVHRPKYPPRDPAVEALAAKLLAAGWSCPECGVMFKRHGRQRYCSPAHAARARKTRWKKKRARAARRQYISDLRARHATRDRIRDRRREAERRIGDYRSELAFEQERPNDGRGGYWGV
jgi:hypothetical protein